MNKLIYLFLIGLCLNSSCKENANNKNNTEINSNTNDSIAQESKITKPKLQKDQLIPKDSLGISFIGKTTQDLDKYNFHVCFGSIIQGKTENDKYALSEYSLSIDNCRNGRSKITFEKFINYYDKGKANFEIKDELLVNSDYPKKCYSSIYLTLNKEPESQYLIEYEDNSKVILTKIFKIWKIDLSQLKFIEVELPKNFTCNNPDYNEEL